MRISDWSSDVCSARARLSIRFNDQQQGAALIEMVKRIARDVDPGAKVVGKISGEAFLTPPGDLSALVAEAIHAETDIVPELSPTRSEERRVGKGCFSTLRCRWSPYQTKK